MKVMTSNDVYNAWMILLEPILIHMIYSKKYDIKVTTKAYHKDMLLYKVYANFNLVIVVSSSYINSFTKVAVAIQWPFRWIHTQQVVTQVFVQQSESFVFGVKWLWFYVIFFCCVIYYHKATSQSKDNNEVNTANRNRILSEEIHVKC